MSYIKHVINLTEDERKQLTKIIKTGVMPAKAIMRANILLASDKNNAKKLTIAETAELFHTTSKTVQNVRNAYEGTGLKATLTRKKRETPPVPAKVTGELEAHIIALCCSQPPEGYSRWTMRLLADKCVELEYVESITPMTISRTLKKTNLSLI